MTLIGDNDMRPFLGPPLVDRYDIFKCLLGTNQVITQRAWAAPNLKEAQERVVMPPVGNSSVNWYLLNLVILAS